MKATAELKMLPVSVLKPAAYNPRKKLKPGDKEYEKIKNSITEFGFADPLVVNADMTIIGGHQRLTVAMELGYVPFDKDWTGFSAEEYREASESVMQEKQQDTVEVMNRLDLSGYEVVRAQYFATLQNPAMTISNGKLRFNTACLKKFEDVEYVELLLNSVDRCIAIRPCEKDNPNAIRWGRLKEGRWCASTLGCRGLAKALFDMMEWEEGLKYRFRGQLVEQNDDKLMLFELDEPEMVKVEEIVLPSKEQDEEGKTVKQTIYIFPPEWAGTFGKPITSIAQVGILQQEHYSGNWDVLRSAAEIEEMNTFTADGLNALLHEAEKIMEGWTDTDE